MSILGWLLLGIGSAEIVHMLFPRQIMGLVAGSMMIFFFFILGSADSYFSATLKK